MMKLAPSRWAITRISLVAAIAGLALTGCPERLDLPVFSVNGMRSRHVQDRVSAVSSANRPNGTEVLWVGVWEGAADTSVAGHARLTCRQFIPTDDEMERLADVNMALPAEVLRAGFIDSGETFILDARGGVFRADWEASYNGRMSLWSGRIDHDAGVLVVSADNDPFELSVR